MPETPKIHPGQIYEPCDPRERSRLRVQHYKPGDNRALVTNSAGKRPRWILVKALHASGTTAQGKPRKTGYRLVQEAQSDA
jgi:hypothetical protein